MAVFAVVPLKKVGFSKRRLSQILSVPERKLLTIAMLEDVFNALRASVVSKIVAVSNDPQVRLIADKFGFYFFSPCHNGLNPAIEEATAWCIKNNADSVLVLPADIPLVNIRDIDMIVNIGSDGKRVVLAPSNDGGTNAFFQHPPHLINACFGKDSFLKHVREACNKGVNVKYYYSARLATDIDSVKDLNKLLEYGNNSTVSDSLYRKLKA